MKIARYGYLNRRGLATLAIVIALSSTLFSTTSLTLLGFYRGLTAYLGEGGNIIAIYDRVGRTPFTGLVPAYLAERIRSLDGVIAASPEALAPCVVNGRALMLRGVVPQEFLKLGQMRFIEGGMFDPIEMDSAVVGINAARKLGIKTGDRILVLGVLTDRYVELRVKGIFVSNTAADDEILAPLYVGQWLRGANYGYVTLIRVEIDNNRINRTAIYGLIAREASAGSSGEASGQGQESRGGYGEAIVPRIVVRFNIETIGVDEARRYMEGYLNRYGLTRESLLTISAAVFLFSSLSVFAAVRTLVAQHRGEIDILRSLGASRRLIKLDLLIKLSPVSIASSLLGAFLAAIIVKEIQEEGYLEVLSHTVPFILDPVVIVLSTLLSMALLVAAIMGLEVEGQ